MPGSPEVLQMMARAAADAARLGCRVEEATLPPVQDYNAVGRVIISSEAYALHEATLKTRLSEYSRVFRVRVLAGALIRAAEYIAAQRRRDRPDRRDGADVLAVRRADRAAHRRLRAAADRAAAG